MTSKAENTEGESRLLTELFGGQTTARRARVGLKRTVREGEENDERLLFVLTVIEAMPRVGGVLSDSIESIREYIRSPSLDTVDALVPQNEAMALRYLSVGIQIMDGYVIPVGPLGLEQEQRDAGFLANEHVYRQVGRWLDGSDPLPARRVAPEERWERNLFRDLAITCLPPLSRSCEEAVPDHDYHRLCEAEWRMSYDRLSLGDKHPDLHPDNTRLLVKHTIRIGFALADPAAPTEELFDALSDLKHLHLGRDPHAGHPRVMQ